MYINVYKYKHASYISCKKVNYRYIAYRTALAVSIKHSQFIAFSLIIKKDQQNIKIVIKINITFKTVF